ncbi:hypothetical protein K2Z83_27375 [Oscillochloris sp. ZM17-4]|uniref:hypothetical protein n=1 Tax=Oscillochloris sp. ZM17-4 TaxID=2866714 RepID=UPI001C733C0D|nr:hypothetical protein [Oscillochloris sp. ZM17-4]MBX0331377.1 hypothetical protein [Oscillochloris sp. ZM17-4]
MTMVLTYRLTLEQPLLATSLEGDPNSSRSFDYIPGGQIRGLLIHRLRAQKGAPADLLADPDVQRRFFSRTTCFLNAYVASDGHTRSLPAPLSLHAHKDDLDKDAFSVLNAADGEGAKQLLAKKVDARWPALKPCFIIPNGTILTRLKIPHTVAIHIQRDRRYGRARRGSGEVFRYDALASGQTFAGAIVCDEDKDAAFLHDLLAADTGAWIGRSRSAGYGRVTIQADAPQPGWREAGEPLPQPTGLVSMTLLSDLLMRDGQGRELTTPDAEALAAALGIDDLTVDLAHSVTSTTLVSSYNTTARLPTPQRHALRAGSVISLNLPATDKPIDLAAIEDRGLGERRAEGFGRVAFGWLAAAEFTVIKPKKPETKAQESDGPKQEPARKPPLLSLSADIAGLMATRRYAEEIDTAIGWYVNTTIAAIGDNLAAMPKNSQLGRVRVLIRRALPAGDVAAVRDGLEDMRQAGYEQFARAPIGGTTLYDWLITLLADAPNRDAAPVWALLQMTPPGAYRVAGIAVPADHPNDPPLAGATALRLAEAILAAVARERRREQEVPA